MDSTIIDLKHTALAADPIEAIISLIDVSITNFAHFNEHAKRFRNLSRHLPSNANPVNNHVNNTSGTLGVDGESDVSVVSEAKDKTENEIQNEIRGEGESLSLVADTLAADTHKIDREFQYVLRQLKNVLRESVVPLVEDVRAHNRLRLQWEEKFQRQEREHQRTLVAFRKRLVDAEGLLACRSADLDSWIAKFTRLELEHTRAKAEHNRYLKDTVASIMEDRQSVIDSLNNKCSSLQNELYHSSRHVHPPRPSKSSASLTTVDDGGISISNKRFTPSNLTRKMPSGSESPLSMSQNVNNSPPGNRHYSTQNVPKLNHDVTNMSPYRRYGPLFDGGPGSGVSPNHSLYPSTDLPKPSQPTQNVHLLIYNPQKFGIDTQKMSQNAQNVPKTSLSGSYLGHNGGIGLEVDRIMSQNVPPTQIYGPNGDDHFDQMGLCFDYDLDRPDNSSENMTRYPDSDEYERSPVTLHRNPGARRARAPRTNTVSTNTGGGVYCDNGQNPNMKSANGTSSSVFKPKSRRRNRNRSRTSQLPASTNTTNDSTSLNLTPGSPSTMSTSTRAGGPTSHSNDESNDVNVISNNGNGNNSRWRGGGKRRGGKRRCSTETNNPSNPSNITISGSHNPSHRPTTPHPNSNGRWRGSRDISKPTNIDTNPQYDPEMSQKHSKNPGLGHIEYPKRERDGYLLSRLGLTEPVE